MTRIPRAELEGEVARLDEISRLRDALLQEKDLVLRATDSVLCANELQEKDFSSQPQKDVLLLELQTHDEGPDAQTLINILRKQVREARKEMCDLSESRDGLQMECARHQRLLHELEAKTQRLCAEVCAGCVDVSCILLHGTVCAALHLAHLVPHLSCTCTRIVLQCRMR